MREQIKNIILTENISNQEVIANPQELTFMDMDSLSPELADLLLSERSSDAIVETEEFNDEMAFSPDASIQLAQTVLDGAPQEEAEDLQLITNNTISGGGLSHLSAQTLTGSLTNEAQPGETTASSSESNTIGFIGNDGSENTVDGLFGIPFELKDFNLSDERRTEEFTSDILVVSAVGVECDVLAVDDFFSINAQFGEGGVDANFYIDLDFNQFLANDFGSNIDLKSFNGQTTSLFDYFIIEAEITTISGDVVDYELTTSILIDFEDFSRLSIYADIPTDIGEGEIPQEINFSLPYEIGNGDPACCDEAFANFNVLVDSCEILVNADTFTGDDLGAEFSFDGIGELVLDNFSVSFDDLLANDLDGYFLGDDLFVKSINGDSVFPDDIYETGIPISILGDIYSYEYTITEGGVDFSDFCFEPGFLSSGEDIVINFTYEAGNEIDGCCEESIFQITIDNPATAVDDDLGFFGFEEGPVSGPVTGSPNVFSGEIPFSALLDNDIPPDQTIFSIEGYTLDVLLPIVSSNGVDVDLNVDFINQTFSFEGEFDEDDVDGLEFSYTTDLGHTADVIATVNGDVLMS